MDIKFEDIITLEDGKEYVVTSKINYKGIDYIYVVDINDVSNIKFAEVEKEGSQIYIYRKLINQKKKFFPKYCLYFLKIVRKYLKKLMNSKIYENIKFML